MSQVYVGNGNGGGGPSTDLHAARYIVSAGGIADGANYTTLAAAYAAAVAVGAPQTVFLQPGTYTANQTLVAGINISAFDCDALTSNVTILGKLSASFAGEVSISGINLQTNSDFCLAVSGANGTLVNLSGCYITVQNNTALSSSGTAGGGINLYGCNGEINGNGLAYFAQSGANTVRFFGGEYQNFGDGLGVSTNSCTVGADCAFYNVSEFGNDITTSNNGFILGVNSNFAGLITLNGTSGSDILYNSQIDGNGSDSALSIGAGATAEVADVIVFSSNTNAITGAGTLKYGLLTFTGSSSTVNTAVQTPLPTLPAFGGSGFTTVNIQTFTSSGTYTPTANMAYCIIECQAGGGAGGGASGTTTFYSSGGGGGGGGYSRIKASAATIGASQTVTIGAGGTPGAAGNNPGGNGGDTSVGSICIAKGGTGGPGSSGTSLAVGGAGGIPGTGDFTFAGQQGGYSVFQNAGVTYGLTAPGGDSFFGKGGVQFAANGSALAGTAGQLYGGGGGGGMVDQSGTAAGAAGAAGVVVITEYIT